MKIGPVDTEILYFGEINKKDKKEEKKITEGKIYSPVGHLAKQANDIRQTVQNTYM